jgi:hypothetical protein
MIKRLYVHARADSRALASVRHTAGALLMWWTRKEAEDALEIELPKGTRHLYRVKPVDVSVPEED